MTKHFNSKNRPSGSERMNGPKVIGEIIEEILLSNEPEAAALRKWIAKRQAEKVERVERNPLTNGNIFLNYFPNTEPCVDLKLITCKQGRMELGEMVPGTITRDDECHYTFLESAWEGRRITPNNRNPHVYQGKRININRTADGKLYPTFKSPEYTKVFTFEDFCEEAAEELKMVRGLLGRKKRG